MTIVGVGTFTITATLAGNNNYDPISVTSNPVTVTKGNQAPIQITGLDTTYTYGTGQITLGLTGGSVPIQNGAVTYVSNNTNVATVSGNNRVNIVGVGTFTITATLAGNNNYNDVNVTSGTVTIGRQPVTLSVGANPTSRPNSVTLSATGLPGDATGTLIFKNGNTIIEDPITIGSGTQTVSFQAAGSTDTYSFTVEYSGDGKYANSVSAVNTFTFTKGTQAPIQITGFNLQNTYTYGDGDVITLGITGGSNISGTVTYVSSNTDVATVSNDKATIVGGGTFTITATLAGDDDYAPVSTTSATITVTKASGAAVGIPMEKSKTINSITVNDVAPPANGQTVEYAYGMTNAAPTSQPQDTTIFDGLTPNTDYYVFARSKENTNYNAGSWSVSTAIRTASTYAFTVSAGTGGTVIGTVSGNYAEGTTISVTAVANSGYTFAGWTINGAAITSGNNANPAAFDMPDNDVTLTAKFSYIGGSGYISSQIPQPTNPPETTKITEITTEPTTPEPEPETVIGIVNGTEMKFKKNANGSVSLFLSGEDIAKYQKKSNVYVIEIKDEKAVNISFSISAVLKTNAAMVQIKTAKGAVVLKRGMLEAYMAQYGDIYEISVREGSLAVELLHNGKVIDWNDAKNPLYISIPVTLAADTTKNGYVAAKKEKSKNTILPYSMYRDGEIFFETASTGTFDVIYNAKTFTDTKGHWGSPYITFVTARNICEPYGAGIFSPETIMTRQLFVYELAKLDGADLSKYKTSRFDDVPAGQWYAAAVEWAVENGIIEGMGGNMFAPAATITREQMASVLDRYIKYKAFDLTPVPSGDVFADDGRISEWAKEAVKNIQDLGIIIGRPGNIFDPQGLATHAEVAAIFTRFVEVYVAFRADGYST